MHKGRTDKPGNVGISFGGSDTRSLQFLKSHDRFNIHEKLISSRYVRNPNYKSAVLEFIKANYFEKGCGLFGRGDPSVLAKLRDLLLNLQISLSEIDINSLVETAVQRTRNWAHLSQLREACCDNIVVREPVVLCPFCKAINGAVIVTDVAYSRFQTVLEMTSEQYEAEMDNQTPDVEAVAILVKQGFIPPYHHGCRGMIMLAR
ncbi:MAG: hypothetical protein M0042_15410 [Nitrospiraceae bacterium]|nr:hypothetical protein [Nitrospiraceae bacterium]